MRREAQRAFRVAPGKSGLHAHGKGERVIALEIWYGNRASRYVKAGLSRSFSGWGRKPWVPSTSAGDLRELLRVPLRSQAYCGFGTGLSGLLWFCGNGKGLVLSGGRNLSRGSNRDEERRASLQACASLMA